MSLFVPRHKLSSKWRAGENQRCTETENEKGEIKVGGKEENSWRSEGQRQRPRGVLGCRRAWWPSRSASPGSGNRCAPSRVKCDSHGLTAGAALSTTAGGCFRGSPRSSPGLPAVCGQKQKQNKSRDTVQTGRWTPRGPLSLRTGKQARDSGRRSLAYK